MKKILFASILALACTSCEHYNLSEIENENTEQTQQTKHFTFHLKGDFAKSFEDMTRAATRLENDNSAKITDVWVLDYDATGTLLQTIHQTTADSNFGSPSIDLTLGHHDLKLIASRGETPSVTASAISWSKVRDTYALNYPIDVTTTSNGNRAPELPRMVSGIKIVISDEVPTTATKLQITYKRSNSLALPSLTPSAVATYTQEFDITALQGYTGTNVSAFTFCPSDIETDVTITALKSDNTKLSEVTVPGITLKQNRMSVLTGNLFSSQSSISFLLSTDWDEDDNHSF